jgi:drug/metabolite transporter (DMT)-like permease
MPLPAILLLLIGAGLHTTWNLVIKGSSEKFVTTWWVVLVGGVASAIGLFFTGLPTRSLWGFVFFSLIAETIYFLILSRAYQDNDFSLIYPIARGAAPAFLALWAFLFLAETPTPGGWLGLGLVIGGLVVIGAGSLLQKGGGKVHAKGIGLALIVALMISTYTAIDGSAVKQGPLMSYALLVFTLLPVPLAPFVLRQYGWPHLVMRWNEQRLRLTFAGLLGVLAYFLALAAYSMAPLNYSGAIREVSVVIGAFAGWKLLGEKLGPLRIIGAGIIFAGILVIAKFG